MNIRSASAIMMGIVCLLPAAALADRTLRCEHRLVSIGDTRREVRALCGDPDHVDRWEEGPNTHYSQLFDYETERYRAPRSIEGPIRMERWTYRPGPQRLVRNLYFENDRLIKIETGPKGADDPN